MHLSILELPPATSGPCSVRYTTDLITESNSLHRDTQQPSERFASSEGKKLIVAGYRRAVSVSPLKGHYTLRDQPRVQKAVRDHLQPGRPLPDLPVPAAPMCSASLPDAPRAQGGKSCPRL